MNISPIGMDSSDLHRGYTCCPHCLEMQLLCEALHIEIETLEVKDKGE